MQDFHSYNERTSSISRIDFTILGNKEIKNLSVFRNEAGGIQSPDIYDNTEPKKKGLIDQRMGITDGNLRCETCGLNTGYCVGHFGHIELAEPVFHIGFYDTIVKILRCVCINCSKLLIHKNENELIEMLKHRHGKHRLMELKNIIKNVSYCLKKHDGCGAPVPKIIADTKKSGSITITAEYSQTQKENEETKDDNKQGLTEILTPGVIYKILRNISENDCYVLGFDPTKNRPEDLIHTIFPVPPVQVRPTSRSDFMASTQSEDQLTIKLTDIVKANIRMQKQKASSDATNEYYQDHINYLQYHIATYMNNEGMTMPTSEHKGMVIKSLSARLKGKEGRLRNNLMGKRVNYSARTVITPDPTLEINELGVPIAIAKNLTFPEIVSPQNIEFLQKLVNNNKKYPGANFVIKKPDYKDDKPVKTNYLPLTGSVELKYGEIVERHLMDGDYVLLNRAPTLHKQSMMALKIKVIDNPDYCTFRFNPAICHPFNADFDGDKSSCRQQVATYKVGKYTL